MTPTALPAFTPNTPSTAKTNKTSSRAKLSASRALKIAGWANIALAAAHLIGLIWAWTMFRSVGIEDEMRELAAQGAALPYLLTLIVATAFLVFGLYALSGAEDLPRLPLLRAGLASIAAIYILRGTLFGGIAAVHDGDGAQIAFAVTALVIGLCYARGTRAGRLSG